MKDIDPPELVYFCKVCDAVREFISQPIKADSWDDIPEPPVCEVCGTEQVI